MDFKGAWEGLTTEYAKDGSWIKFYATENAKNALREDPARIQDWLTTMHDGAAEFIGRELALICTSSHS